MKKIKTFTLIITLFITTILILSVSLFYKKINFNEINHKSYKEVASDTKYYDWSDINSGVLKNGIINSDYSYSTIFFTEQTTFEFLNTIGMNVQYTSPAEGSDIKINLPTITNLTDGEELVFKITNCAVNKDGKILDVIIKINNINTWTDDGNVYLNISPYVSLLNSQNAPVAQGEDYRIPIKIGDPINFELYATKADCEFSITYYEHDTYNSSTNTGTLGNINYINGFYYDIDVLSIGQQFSQQLFNGNEGIIPTIGTSQIYYNKNKIKIENSQTATILKEVENGIAISSGLGYAGSPNGIWFATSMFMATETPNSTLKIKYGGQGCGLNYLFASPYPYPISPPIKKVTKKEITKNETINYEIEQIIPNNYYGSVMDFSEIYQTLHNSTHFSSLKINDTLDQNLLLSNSKEDIKIYNIDNNDVTNYFDISIGENNTINFVAKNDYFSKQNFYNNKYKLVIPVKLKNDNISKVIIPNKASTTSKIGTNLQEETMDSNEVEVKVYYTIKVKHIDEYTKEVLKEETIKKYLNENYITNNGIFENYDYSRSEGQTSGTISNNITINYYYKRKSNLKVNHYLIDGKTTLYKSTNNELYWGDNYSTEKISINNYSYSKQTGHAPIGKVEQDNIEINYFYQRKTATLIVKHLEKNTNKELASQQVETKKYGEKYETTLSSKVAQNYELHSKTNNFTGTVSTDQIEVIYYYQLKDSNLETTISKIGPEQINKKDEPVKYDIQYTVKITDYIGPSTITIIDTLPFKINKEKSQLDGGRYDEESQTITWIIQWSDIDTYNGKSQKEINKRIELIYLNIKGKDRTMINSIKGSIKLDNNERDIEDQTSTDIKIPGTIITHHYIKGTKEKLFDDDESNNLVGESYITSSKEKEGYIVTKPSTEEYKYQEEPQEVIYEYEKIKFKITTEVDGEGGTIKGDEEVEYGENSTKNFIVIKPNNGYILDKIYINNEEIELTEYEKKKLTLNNFVNILEDKNIKVTFKKDKEVFENPDTGATASFIMILIGVLTINIIYLKNHKPKIFKLN